MFYVYVYLDPRKFGKFSYESVSFLYEPLYVGKGRSENKRHLKHLEYLKTKGNKYFKHKLLKLLSNFSKQEIVNHIILLRENLSEQEAFNLETRLIGEIGRADLKLGPLVNLTDGGEGTSGLHKTVSEKTRRKISEIHKGKIQSQESRRKCSDSLRGITRSVETKEKMSTAKMGEKNPIFGKHRSEQVKQRISNKLSGEKGFLAKLSKKQVHQMHQLLKLQFKSKDIARLYKVNVETVRYVKRGDTWKSIFNVFNKNAQVDVKGNYTLKVGGALEIDCETLTIKTQSTTLDATSSLKLTSGATLNIGAGAALKIDAGASITESAATHTTLASVVAHAPGAGAPASPQSPSSPGDPAGSIDLPDEQFP